MADNINFVTTAVIRGCQEKNVETTEVLAAFVARARVLEAPELFQPDKKLNEEDVNGLIATCVERLCARDSPQLKTIELQVQFEQEYQRQRNAIERAANIKNARLSEIFKEIEGVRVKSESDFDALSVLYRKIFNFAMVCTGSDQLDDRAVERETAAALESVFPRVALPSFVSLGTADKRVQLHELSNIVFGIRLFNKKIGKGGAGIEDANAALDEEMASMSDMVQQQIAEVESVLEQYVDVMRYLRSAEPEKSDMAKRLQAELVFWRQFQAFQLQLQDEVRIIGEHVRSTRDVFDADLAELQGIVGAKTSVPKEKVYPRFDALANMWNIFTEENQNMSLLKAVHRELGAFRDQPFKPMMRSKDVTAARAALAGESDVAEPAPAEVGGSGEPAGETALVPAHLLENPNVRLELKGFDPVAVAERDGLLLPGKPEHGYVRHRGLYYAVSEPPSATKMLADPEKILQGVKDAARSTPEMVHVLGLGASFPTVAVHHMVSEGVDMGDGSLLYQGGIDTRASKEMGSQTHVVLTGEPADRPQDCHAVASYIDKNYEWNEWALRRRALMLTNLRTKKTTSTQSAQSHFRRENATQHYPQRDNVTNTATSVGTAPRRESNYVTGLRGHPDEKMHVVNISLDF